MRTGGAAMLGATALVLMGLAGIALGVYLWAFEAARPAGGSSGGISFAGVGYALAVILVVIASPLVGVGISILWRPTPGRVGIGAAMSAGYALIMLWLGSSAFGYQRGRPFDPSTAVPFVAGGIFLLAALMLSIALVTAGPSPNEASPPRRARRHPEQWQGDPRVETRPPGSDTRRP
jgi:hypothetical protein